MKSLRWALVAGLAASTGFAQTDGPATAAPAPDNVQKLAEFVVTVAPAQPFQNGNLDLPRTSDDVQPYTMINQEAIQESNAYDLDDFLKDELTQNTIAQSYSQVSPTTNVNGNFGTSSQVNLRGLGNLQSLMLVNGYRLAPYNVIGATYQPNINWIPLAAIDHVEVLPSSASAIYGSSAVGGVVNIVLKKDYSGGEIETTYQNTGDGRGPQEKLDATYGFSIGGKLHVSLVASFADGKPLLIQDRSFLMDYYDRALKNDPAILYSNTVPYGGGTTPNIALDTAVVNGYTNPQSKTLTLTNGTSLNSLTTSIPIGTSLSTPTATLDSGLLADAGSYNLNWAPSVYRGLDTPIGEISRKRAFLASVQYDVNPWIQAFVNYSNAFSGTLGPLVLLTGSGTDYSIPVPGNAPDNPFQENVLISIPVAQSQSGYSSVETESKMVTGGLLAHLPAGWQADLDYTLGESELSYYKFGGILNNAIGGLNGASPLLYNGTLDPFVDTIQNPPNLRSAYYFAVESGNSTLEDFNLRGSGPVLTLPGGSVRLTLGLEERLNNSAQDLLYNIPPPTPPINTNSELRDYPGGRQTTQAIYAETEVPIIAAKNQIPLVNELDLQGAARTEKFGIVSDSGIITSFPYLSPPTLTSTLVPSPTHSRFTSTNPTLGLKYKPFPALAFRASYATAFVPPTAAQLTSNPAPATTETANFFDPVTGQTYTTERNSGTNGNSDLKPQTTTDWDLGVIWEPQQALLQGLRVNLEYFKIKEKNLIFAPANVTALVNAPAYAKDLTRDPTTGLITFADFQYTNAAEEYTDGWDFSFDYRRKVPGGTLNLHAGATVTEHLKAPTAPGEPLVEYVGYVDSGGVDKVKANAVLSWYVGSHWTFSWRTVFYDGYKQEGAPSDPEYNGAATYTPDVTSTLPQGGYTIPSQLYHNVFAGYNFGVARNSLRALDGVTVQAGVNDLFNTAPPFDANAQYLPYYYSPFGSPNLRTLVLKVAKAF